MSISGDQICSIWAVVRLVWSEWCVVRAVIEVIRQGQSEVSRGIVKYVSGKCYDNNLGKWSDVYWVRRAEVIHQGQSEVSRGTVKYVSGKGYDNNLGKWSDAYWVRRSEVIHQGQSEVSRGKVKWDGGIA
jgi:hypothetical protein